MDDHSVTKGILLAFVVVLFFPILFCYDDGFSPYYGTYLLLAAIVIIAKSLSSIDKYERQERIYSNHIFKNFGVEPIPRLETIPIARDVLMAIFFIVAVPSLFIFTRLIILRVCDIVPSAHKMNMRLLLYFSVTVACLSIVLVGYHVVVKDELSRVMGKINGLEKQLLAENMSKKNQVPKASE